MKISAGLMLCVLFLPTICAADPIIFTLNGVGTGTIGATPFTAASFVFTLTTDTTLITSFAEGVTTPPVAGAGISIAGFGAGTFSNLEDVFDNQNFGTVGITDSVHFDLLDGDAAILTTYDLRASLGPLPLTSLFFEQFSNVPTSLGNVTFSSVSSAAFTASSVPEPAALLLCGFGLLVLMLGRAKAAKHL